MTAVIAISLGFIFGSWSSAACAWFFFVTRPYRRTGKFSIIGLGYLVVAALCLAPFLLMSEVLDELGSTQGPAGEAAYYTYALTIAGGAFVVVWTEIRWRKSMGIGGSRGTRQSN